MLGSAGRGGASGSGVTLDVVDISLQLLSLNLFGSTHLMLDLRAHVRHAYHDQPRLAGIEVLAHLLEIVPAHPGRRVPGDGTQNRPAGRRGRQQPSADRGEGEQGNDQAGG
jgi:hypothetical protein